MHFCTTIMNHLPKHTNLEGTYIYDTAINRKEINNKKPKQNKLLIKRIKLSKPYNKNYDLSQQLTIK